jgi:acetyl esterase/lipase
MKRYLFLLVVCALMNVLLAEKVATMNVWPGKAPGAMGEADRDIPTITVYVPQTAKKPCAAILICPGGGYGGLCSSYEGHDIANWLDQFGIAGVVLKYRLNPYRHPIPMNDAQRAMRLVRSHAAEWGIDANRLGIMGFSAGGHLASTVGTHYDRGIAGAMDVIERFSCRPDFMVLVYPVISMGKVTHGGSRRNLLGDNPSQEKMDNLSNELLVTEDTPPAFLAHSVKDTMVNVENSRLFANALKAKGVAVTLFELPKGEHGLGCGKGDEWASWQAECVKWLKENKLTDR